MRESGTSACQGHSEYSEMHDLRQSGAEHARLLKILHDQYNTKAYSDIPEMVMENNIDLVIVCTPHPFHKQPAMEAATAGANVLVEKPLACRSG